MPRFWPAARSRLLLLVAALAACLAFWWLAKLVGFPRYPGYNASLLLQPIPTALVLATVVCIAALTTIGTLLAGRVRYDAGWVCCALGLYALRLRGGPIATTIADRPAAVFVTLAIELALLGAVLGAAWSVLHRLRERGSAFKSLRRFLELPEAATRIADRKAAAETLDQKILALVLTTSTMAVFMLILCRTGARAQVFFSVGISAYLSVWIAHSFIPTRPGAWFWSAPIICGIAGYLLAWVGTSPSQLAIGEPGGYFAALAHPLPLDYASIGVAAALWRYVQSRTHQLQRVAEAQRQEHVTPAPAGGADAGTYTSP